MKHLSSFCIASLVLLSACTSQQPEQITLTILHTNDTHSQIEPIAATATKNANEGGYARRMGLIEQERQADPDLLLLDAGDFSQGTPYFNFYHGRIEVDALNRMGYDACTLGNHEFDNGLDTLAAVLRGAKFPILVANYEVEGTPLEGIVRPYTIIRRKGLKIGIIGLGVNPDGLIAAHNFEPVVYHEPLPAVEKYGQLLKDKEHCDLVVCLSHIGTDANGINDLQLAHESHYIDIFIGGHTHQIYNGHRVNNSKGEEVVLSQAGKSGCKVGKIVLNFDQEEAK